MSETPVKPNEGTPAEGVNFNEFALSDDAAPAATETPADPAAEGGVPPTGAEEKIPAQDTEDEAASLQAAANSNKEIMDAIQGLSARLAQPAQPAAPEKPQGPKYNFAIPEQLQQLILSEDPAERMNGFATALSAAVNHVYNDIKKEIETTYRDQFLQLVTTQQTQQSSVEKMRNDFYGKHKTLNTQAGKTLVAAVTQEIVRQWTAKGKQVVWGPEFMDAVANSVYALAPTLKPKAAPVAEKKAPFVAGNNARPAAGAPTIADQIKDLVSL